MLHLLQIHKQLTNNKFLRACEAQSGRAYKYIHQAPMHTYTIDVVTL